MSVRRVSSCLVFTAFAVASCAVGLGEESLVQDDPGALGEEGSVASTGQSLTKGTVGAVNGDKDYCDDPLNPCVQGEGDCDSAAQCTGGTRCLGDNGAKFGFPGGWDVCAPMHCSNGLLDAGQGETTPDCGGPCGTCVPNCSGTAGGKDFCMGCACASGQGDCDSSTECQAGLICAADNGPFFGLPNGYDVCVPPHCTNRVQDAGSGETGVDFGGPCGANVVPACVGTPGGKAFCLGCKCASGQGDCDGNGECNTGLVCAVDNGPKFALPTGYDVCVPPHCTNGVQDTASGETGVDVGGPCSAGGSEPPPTRNVFFSEYVEGTGNSHAVEIYNAGGGAESCVLNVYFSGATTPGSTITLAAPIAPLDVYVVCRSGGAITTPPCDQSSGLLTFTGDDAIELVCSGVTQDIVGQIGFDPGSQWGTGNASTADNTMRRKCSVTTGDTIGTDAFVPSVEWDGFANNDFTDVGARVCP